MYLEFVRCQGVSHFASLFPSRVVQILTILTIDRLHSNKNITSYIRQDGGTTKLDFRWLPNGNSAGLEQYLTQEIAASTTPTHIFFGISLWLAKKAPEEYERIMRPTLEVLSRVVPEAKIASRTSGGVVQAIECYDQIGGQRGQMEGLNDGLKRILVDFPRVRPFDAYRLFNDRPDGESRPPFRFLFVLCIVLCSSFRFLPSLDGRSTLELGGVRVSPSSRGG